MKIPDRISQTTTKLARFIMLCRSPEADFEMLEMPRGHYKTETLLRVCIQKCIRQDFAVCYFMSPDAARLHVFDMALMMTSSDGWPFRRLHDQIVWENGSRLIFLPANDSWALHRIRGHYPDIIALDNIDRMSVGFVGMVTERAYEIGALVIASKGIRIIDLRQRLLAEGLPVYTPSQYSTATTFEWK